MFGRVPAGVPNGRAASDALLLSRPRHNQCAAPPSSRKEERPNLPLSSRISRKGAAPGVASPRAQKQHSARGLVMFPDQAGAPLTSATAWLLLSAEGALTRSLWQCAASDSTAWCVIARRRWEKCARRGQMSLFVRSGRFGLDGRDARWRANAGVRGSASGGAPAREQEPRQTGWAGTRQIRQAGTDRSSLICAAVDRRPWPRGVGRIHRIEHRLRRRRHCPPGREELQNRRGALVCVKLELQFGRVRAGRGLSDSSVRVPQGRPSETWC